MFYAILGKKVRVLLHTATKLLKLKKLRKWCPKKALAIVRPDGSAKSRQFTSKSRTWLYENTREYPLEARLSEELCRSLSIIEVELLSKNLSRQDA